RELPTDRSHDVLHRHRGELRHHEARVPRDHRVRGLVHPAPDQAPVGVTEPSEGERRVREVENLRAVYQSLQPPKAQGEGRSSHAGKAAAGAAGAGLLFVLGKAKFFGLLAGLVKFKTLATMLLSIGAYAVEWGWLFAAGFVLLIFVHEMGHAVGIVGLLVTRSPLLLIVLLVGLWSLVQRWRNPVAGYDSLPPRQRTAIALWYAALVIGLVATLAE